MGHTTDEREGLLRQAACVLVSLAGTLDYPGGTFQYVDMHATDRRGRRIDGGSIATASAGFLLELASAANQPTTHNP